MQLALSVLRQTPFLVACLAILLVAVIRWRRHPRVSALAAAGSLILLLAALIALFWDMFYTRNPRIAGTLHAAESLVAWSVPLLQAGGVMLLLWALFSDRETRTAEPDDDDHPVSREG
jgi:hypothetical protein